MTLITKLGLKLSLGKGFSNFKANITPALRSLKNNTGDAFRAGYTNAKNYPGIIGKPNSFLTTVKNRFGMNLTQDQRSALAFGAKGIGTLGVLGVASNMGNKDYQDNLDKIRLQRKYTINPNIPPNDPTEQGT